MTFMRNGLSCLVAICLLALALPGNAEAAKLAGYDPQADAGAALNAALAEAKASNKKVLIVAGGDWCVWCHYLESFIAKNKDVDTALHGSFVTLKVYIGPENKNEKFFSKLPKAAGYPHFWVVSGDGVILSSVNTGTLEDGGKSYNKKQFMNFIRKAGG